MNGEEQLAREEVAEHTAQPTTQSSRNFRQHWPEWLRQMPHFRLPPADENYQLIDRQRVEELLEKANPETARRIRDDINYMDHELLRLFRLRDRAAAVQQNRYRLYHVAYIVLAAVAALVGAALALSLSAQPSLVPWLAFTETALAMGTAVLSSMSSRRPPLTEWLANRRLAEQLRREYFRYLINLPPYNETQGYAREMLLSRRAAEINRDSTPD